MIRRELLDQLVMSVDEVERIAPQSWAVTQHERGFRLNVGPAEAFACIDHSTWFLLGCDPSEVALPTVTQGQYASVPGPQAMYFGSPEDFVGVRKRLWEAHRRYLKRAALKRDGQARRCSYARYDCPAVVECARQELGSKPYQFDKPRPGETAEEYLLRHDAHPSSPHPRESTLADEIASDRTQVHLNEAFILSFGGGTQARSGNPYNGYSWDERMAKYVVMQCEIKAGRVAAPHGPCRLCGDPASQEGYEYHDEDYSQPYSWAEPAAFMLCKACHRRIHQRFSNPHAWHAFVAHVRRGGFAADLKRLDVGAELADHRRALRRGLVPPVLRPLRNYPAHPGGEWFAHLSMKWDEMSRAESRPRP